MTTPATLTPTRQHPTTAAEPGRFAAAGLLAALEKAWATFCAHHPDLPSAVIVIASGTDAGTPRWGHYAALRWQHGDTRLPEVLVGGEGLIRPAAEVLATLLHEAAHALADVRDIQDTSRQGRWHNRRFAMLAEELGLDTTKTDKTGWSTTTLRPETARRYHRLIAAIERAQAGAYRHAEPATTGTEKKNNNPPPCVCGCLRKIRVSPTVLAEGPITCGVCDTNFTPEPDDTDGGQL